MAGERILVVDDERWVLDACKRALTRRQYEVHTAGTGADALARLRQEVFDLLVTDIRMPEVDGLELLRRVREADPSLATVVLTGHGTLDLAIESITLGVSGFILKPFTLEELVSAIDDALARAHRARTPVRPRATQLVRRRPHGPGEPALGLRERLTPRECEVLRLMAQGLTNREIGCALQISWGTAKTHVQHIIAKLGVSDRTQAAVLAIELDLITLKPT